MTDSHYEPYLYGYSLADDHLWVELIRTYSQGQFEQAVATLKSIARQHGLPILRGAVLGEARRRLFVMKGWTCTSRVGDRFLVEIPV